LRSYYANHYEGLQRAVQKGYDGAQKGYGTTLMKTAKLSKADGTVVADRCHLAFDPWSRMRGLLGRASLAPGEAMLFRPTGSIHMFFMRFTIDAVFCDRDLVVIGVVPALRPWRMASRRGAKVVIELAEGAAAGVRPGDHLALATIEE
jgi:uncharacterized membrane protein (UPF0127 family)